MRLDVAKNWAEALKSGEFTQGELSLHFNNAYCCLGVLCELAIRDGVEVIKDDSHGRTRFDGRAIYLPQSVMTWAGIKTEHGVIHGTSLSSLNDSKTTFVNIAKIIEDNVEIL